MGRTSNRHCSDEGAKKWNNNSKDGRKLIKLSREGRFSAGTTLSVVKRQYPQLKKYSPDAFSAALRRAKNDLAVNIRGSGMLVQLVIRAFLLFLMKFIYYRQE